MYKKIGVILLALILMFNFTLKDYADAAIATKAAGQAAKQVAKEVIQDIAVETAANFALQQAMDIVNGYEADQGYKVICPDGSKTCDKPVQIKQNISELDKIQIKQQSGNELDKLLNGGAGVSKWQKFLDWFLPVWLISFGATALTYAFDSDVRSLFNEAAYNTLVALGIIKPVDSLTSKEELEPSVVPVDIGDGNYEKDGVAVKAPQAFIMDMWNSTDSAYNNSYVRDMNHQNQLYTFDLTPQFGAGTLDSYILASHYTGYSLFGFDLEYLFVGNTSGLSIAQSEDSEVTVNLNGKTAYHGAVKEFNPVGANLRIPWTVSPTMQDISIHLKKLKSILHRTPYEMNGFYYSDTLYNTVDGNIINVQVKSREYNPFKMEELRQKATYRNVSPINVSKGVLTVFPDQTPQPKKLVVNYEDIGTMEKSNYESDKGNIALIPPAALTYKEEETGETVYRVPAAVPTNPPVFQKEDGTPVPEENVTVDPAPTVKPAPNGSTTEKGEPIPEGTPTVTPAPTPSNPAPSPIPLTPAPTPTPTTPTPEPTTPVEPPTTGDPPTTGEPIPEGPGCEEKFKFPILSPLKETFSTSFPFSIPWDIERAINAAFSGIGHEKPKFNLDLNVLGQKETIEITTPKMFDDWKPFTDTLLVLTFDVLIMFGVYRFVKGAGS